MMKIQIVFSLLFLIGSQSEAQVFYVAPQGQGDSYSQSAPGNIEGLPSLLRKNSARDIEIRFLQGYYFLDQPVAFSNAELTESRQVILRAEQPGEVVLGSGIRVENWKLHSRSKNIWVTSLNDQSNFRELYIDNKPAVRARFPDMENEDDGGPYFKTINIDPVTKHYRLKKSDLPPEGISSGMELIVHPHWYHSILRIAYSDLVNDTVLVQVMKPEADFAFLKHANFYRNNSFYYENHFSFLSKPREWFYDPSTMQLFLVMERGANPAQHKIYIPQLESLLTIKGEKGKASHNIKITGITFKHTKWEYPLLNGLVATQGMQPLGGNDVFEDGIRVPAALLVEYCRNFRIENCHFTSLGAHGVVFRAGVQKSNIEGCTFRYIGADAVEVDAQRVKFPDDEQVCAYDTIRNCTIEKAGAFYTSAQGILVSYVRSIVIENNEISSCPYSGIQVGNQPGEKDYAGVRDNIIRRNHIHHVMLHHDDGGGIYTLSSQPGTIISENYIHDIRRNQWAQDAPVAGIYLDTAGQFIEITGNAMHDCHQNLYLQLKHRVRNNIIKDNEHLFKQTMENAGPKIHPDNDIMTPGP